MVFNNTLTNCATAPASAQSDAGVAGTGILLAFIITAALALILSSVIIFSEWRAVNARNIPRRILSGLSDQQLIQGIGIQIIGLVRINTMIPYHFFIIWMLALLSTATNFAALLALVQDFKRDWVLRWMRQFAMFVNMVLGIVYGIFVLESNVEALAPTLPIACVWQEDHARSREAQGDKTASVVGTIVVIAVSCIIFVLGTWYLHMRRQIWGKSVRAVSLVVLMAMAIAAAVRVILVSQAFGTPSVVLDDAGEKDWSFGQLLTMLLLVLPFISALEIYRGETQIPQATAAGYSDVEQIPLTSTNSSGMKAYQANTPYR